MVWQIIKKILMMIPILLLVSIILFFLLRALPGDAAIIAAGQFATDEDIAEYREKLGLDKPLYQQYFAWLSGMLHGDFGSSLLTGKPVADKIKERLPATMELALLAILCSVVIAIPLGIASAVNRNTGIDSAVSVISLVGISMPEFWLATLLVILFSLKLHLLPASGYIAFAGDPLDSLKLMILPAVSIGVTYSAITMRQTRNAFLEVLDQDFIVTAKAKGLSGRIIIWKHALKNALIPIITVVGMQTGKLFGGAVVAETIFIIPGLGNEIVGSIMNRDYPTTMGVIMMVAVIIIFINTFIDIIYSFIDPRVGRSK